MNEIKIIAIKSEPRVDTRELAAQLGNRHKNVLELIDRYAEKFRRFGHLPFKTEAVKNDGARGIKHGKYALLNEDQSYFLLSLSRNSERVVELKANLVLAFKDARLRAQRTTARERVPMVCKTVYIGADRGVSPTKIQGNVNRWAGVKRSRHMTLYQLGESLVYCDRLMERAETDGDAQRIADNSIALYGQPPQMSLFQHANADAA